MMEIDGKHNIKHALAAGIAAHAQCNGLDPAFFPPTPLYEEFSSSMNSVSSYSESFSPKLEKNTTVWSEEEPIKEGDGTVLSAKFSNNVLMLEEEEEEEDLLPKLELVAPKSRQLRKRRKLRPMKRTS